MDAHAPALIQALESSPLGAAIRQSTWIYPLANVAHVVAVVVFAAGVAIMDVRLLGGFRGTSLLSVLHTTRRVTVSAFIAVAARGFVLITAEASHLTGNHVFQLKLELIELGLANVLVLDRVFAARLRTMAPDVASPLGVRSVAFASLAIWLAVVVIGRSIAYF